MVEDTDQTIVVETTEKEDLPVEVIKLEKIIQEANGSLILLKKRSRFGEPMYIMVTQMEFKPDERQWQQYMKNGWFYPVTGINYVDLFVGDDSSELAPIGRYHMAIRGNQAVGSAQLSDEQYDSLYFEGNEYIQKAMRWNRNGTSLKRDPEYRKQGLGDLMTVVGLATLDVKKIKEFYPTSLTLDSYELWKRFGVSDNNYINKTDSGGTYDDEKPLIIRELLSMPISISAIKEFF